MNLMDTKKRKAALRKAWKQINGPNPSSVDNEGLFLLAAAQVGPRKYVKIAELAGLSRSQSLKLSRRARETGLFSNMKILHSGWLDPEDGGIAFLCDVLVLAGQFERVSP